MHSTKDITLEVGTLNNSGNITSPERICIKTISALNNIGYSRIDSKVVYIEGRVSNSEQATISGSKSLTLPASLIQYLVGAECVTAEAVNSMQEDLATRGGSLIGSTLTVNPLRWCPGSCNNCQLSSFHPQCQNDLFGTVVVTTSLDS